MNDRSPPEILAPAGNRASFLAAVAAGADAVYCGLKLFSARMEAKNFTLEEFAALVQLAHQKGVKVFVALNALLKPDDLVQAGHMLEQLQSRVKPDAVIIQDLALVSLVKQTGFSGQIHLSTLANASFPKALQVLRHGLRVDRVVLPRELNIDELKTMARFCPRDLDLEVFIHGALCYSISGRCYWSSYLGGKSSLRGRCVQPCRRRYTQGRQNQRYFSCQDLSVDVLAKLLLSIPQVRTWKIEGRKKGPHYVYYTVCGYRMLRDHGWDPKKKKDAVQMLGYALGRSTTHYYFLPQRPQNPVKLKGQTGSGMQVGSIKGSRQKPYFHTRVVLMPADVLRLGYADQRGHLIKRVARSVPKGGRLDINVPNGKYLVRGTPVFLIDRREKSLNKLIVDLESEINQVPALSRPRAIFKPALPKAMQKKRKPLELSVYRSRSRTIPPGPFGLWLSNETIKKAPARMIPRIWWWLPPVIWPENENLIDKQVQTIIRKGASNFVMNAVWQIGFIRSSKTLNLWAGPFCNLANPLAIASVERLGFIGAIVSPELGAEDVLRLPQLCPIPLGIVTAGSWPLCVARSMSDGFQLDKPFTSPKGEQAWATRYGSDYWVFPNWKLDLQSRKKALQKSGYSVLVTLVEPLPKGVKFKKRSGIWNWKTNLQ